MSNILRGVNLGTVFADRIIREAECRKITGLSRTTRWRRTQTGHFPKGVRISDSIIGWKQSDLQAWINSL